MLQQTYAGVDPIFLEWLCFNKENPVNCWEAYGFKRKFDAMVISSQVDYFGLYAIIEL
jgi:hypothetical protein